MTKLKIIILKKRFFGEKKENKLSSTFIAFQRFLTFCQFTNFNALGNQILANATSKKANFYDFIIFHVVVVFEPLLFVHFRQFFLIQTVI